MERKLSRHNSTGNEKSWPEGRMKTGITNPSRRRQSKEGKISLASHIFLSFFLLGFTSPFWKALVLSFLKEERGHQGRPTPGRETSPHRQGLIWLQMSNQRKCLWTGNHKCFFYFEKLYLFAQGRTDCTTSCFLFSQSQHVLPFSCHSGICCLAPKPLSPAQGKASGAAWIRAAQGSVCGQVLWAVFSVVKEDLTQGMFWNFQRKDLHFHLFTKKNLKS